MATGDIIHTWFEGHWHEGNPPVMRAADHAIWLGTLVFDGARSFNRAAPDLKAHCERVNNSALALGLKPTHTADELVTLTKEGLNRFNIDAAVYIRPMYWSTEGTPSVVLADADSTVFCLCLEQVPMPSPDATQRLTTTRFVRPMLTMATVNAKAACLYPNNGRMLREAIERGFTNALVADPLGNVAETATSNIFMVRDGAALTPAPNGTFLNGITRQRIIQLLTDDGLEVIETTLTFNDFHTADEVFMTGNLSKVTPVTQFDSTHYQTGLVAQRARELYWRWAQSESL